MSTTPEADEFSLEVAGKRFRGWFDMELAMAIDAVHTCTFSAPFEPTNAEFRELFRPYKYQPVKVYAGTDVLFSGTMVNVVPQSSAGERTVKVDCYSTCGVLGDCNVPASAYPIQFDGLKLDKIARQLCEPFGLTPIFAVPEAGEEVAQTTKRGKTKFGTGSKFDKVALEPTTKILDFLKELAQQRGIIITSDADGNPFFQQSADPYTDEPVATLRGDQQPVLSVAMAQAGDGDAGIGQGFFSEITGISKTKNGRPGSKYTEGNTWLQSALRPVTFEVDDTDPADLPHAVQTKLGQMFALPGSYDVEVASLFDQFGALWRPNTFIRLKDPNAMIYQETTFLVRGVVLRPHVSQKTATLAICLPGAFSGEIPEVLPWDD